MKIIKYYEVINQKNLKKNEKNLIRKIVEFIFFCENGFYNKIKIVKNSLMVDWLNLFGGIKTKNEKKKNLQFKIHYSILHLYKCVKNHGAIKNYNGIYGEMMFSFVCSKSYGTVDLTNQILSNFSLNAFLRIYILKFLENGGENIFKNFSFFEEDCEKENNFYYDKIEKKLYQKTNEIKRFSNFKINKNTGNIYFEDNFNILNDNNINFKFFEKVFVIKYKKNKKVILEIIKFNF